VHEESKVSGIIRHLRDELTNLSPAEDGFWGRETLMAAVCAAMDAHGFVTLVGPGGVGKSRLAQAVGGAMLERFPGGVWWLDLADAVSPEELPQRFATTLGLRLTGQDAVGAIEEILKHRPASLYILDNLEQLVPALGETLTVWRKGAPHCSFLATSREVLRLKFEQVIPVPPLSEESALRLFEARVQARKPSFRLEEKTMQRAKELVAALDGLPLALELAAGRAAFLGVEELCSRLNERFRYLADASQGRSERHSRLEDTIAWSWELLHPWEQAVLAQSSVFHGVFEPMALAEMVEPGDWPEAPWALDIVQSLCDKSLLRVVNGGLRHFESVRLFAEHRLRAASSDAWDAACLRHATWYADGWEDKTESADPDALANLVAGATQASGVPAARCAVIVYERPVLLYSRPWLRALLESASQAVSADSELGIRVGLHVARMQISMGEREAGEARLNACEQALVRHPSDWLAARLWRHRSFLQWRSGEKAQAGPLLQKAVQLAERSGRPKILARCLREQGAQSLWGDLDQARQLVERAIALIEECGARKDAGCFVILGESHRMVGRWTPAMAALTQVTNQAESMDPISLLQAYANQVAIYLELHQLDAADRVLQQAERIAKQSGNYRRQLLLRKDRAQFLCREARWEALHDELASLVEALAASGLPGHHVQAGNQFLAPIKWRLNRLEESASLHRSLVAFHRANEPVFGEAIAGYFNMTRALLAGRLSEAHAFGLSVLPQGGLYRNYVWMSAMRTAYVERLQGNFQDAEERLNQAIAVLRQKEIQGWVARLITERAWVALDQGQLVVAGQLLEEALEFSAKEGDLFNLIHTRVAMAARCRLQGVLEQALEQIKKAEALWPASRAVALRGWIALEKGRVLLAMANGPAARVALQQAERDLGRAGERWEWIVALCWLGKAQEEPELARMYLSRIQKLVAETGDRSAVEIMEWIAALEARLASPESSHVLVLVQDPAMNQQISDLLEAAGHRVSSAHSCAELEGHLTERVDAMVFQVPLDGEFQATLNWLQYGLGGRTWLWVGTGGPEGCATIEPEKLSTLAHRLEAGLRQTPGLHDGVLVLGTTRIDLVRREIQRDGEVQPLRELEARLVAYLAGQGGRVVPREELLEAVWGYASGAGSRTVDTTVGRLRKKVEAVPGEPRFLFTVRRQGYCLKDVSRETGG
jgi:predicted ATPase/DNA-binding response OmpR family regulator